MGVSGPSLLIESTDSMITMYTYIYIMVCLSPACRYRDCTGVHDIFQLDLVQHSLARTMIIWCVLLPQLPQPPAARVLLYPKKIITTGYHIDKA